MAKIEFFQGVTYQKIPCTKSVRVVDHDILVSGFKELVSNCSDLASIEGGTIGDTFTCMGSLLADFANLLQLDNSQVIDIFGADYAASLFAQGLLVKK